MDTKEAVVLYSRYSSDNQSDNSLEYQLAAATDFCRAHHLKLVEVYSDAASTGTSDKRQAFQRMMADARSDPPWRKVLFYKLSRFSRNAADHMKYEGELKKLGIECVSITEFFPDTPLGRHEKRVQASHNQLVSEETAEHTFSGMMERAKQCSHCGGRPPLGYKIVNKRLVIDEEGAEIVRLIFRMKLDGYSLSEMAQHLNSQGYKTREGGDFSKNSFDSILRQEKYTGMFIWNKSASKSDDKTRNAHAFKAEGEQIRVEGGCPAIIDCDTFDRVQSMMAESRKSGNRPRHHYMLTRLGLLKCGACGAAMQGAVRTAHNGKKYAVYLCPNHHAKDRSCPTRDARTECVDDFVSRSLVAGRFIKSDTPALANAVTFGDEIKRLERQKHELERAIQATLALNEQKPSQAAQERYYQRCDELEAVTARLSKLRSRKTAITADNIGKVIHDFRRELMVSDDPDVREYLRQHIGSIIYDNNQTTITINTGVTGKDV